MKQTPEFLAITVARFYQTLREQNVPEDVAQSVTLVFAANVVENARDNPDGSPELPQQKQGEQAA